MKPIYDEQYTYVFHSPAVEPWICGLLRRFKPSDVLDVGCGLGLWGLILKGYLGCPRVVGVDVDHAKVDFAKRLGVYDELYASDVRAFSYPKPFDAIVAVEAVHSFLDAELLRRLEGLASGGGLIVLALPALPARFARSIAASELAQRGYVVYRYFLRGFILVRIDKAEVHTIPSRLWRALGHLIRLFSPMLKLLGVLERGYLLAYKVV
jgi:SAM-dependent methyltransferase